jgi:hypothetical protein
VACPRSGTSAWSDGLRALAYALTIASAAATLGCHGAADDPPGAATSPQANAEPALLANVAVAGGGATSIPGADAGTPPEALRADRAVPTDTPKDVARDTNAKEPPRDPTRLAGYSLAAVVRTGEGPPPPKWPEVNTPSLEAARRKSEARIAIDLTPSRARFVLTGGFVLPQATELRARSDRYGHLVLWPGEETYRVAEPGTLRALLGERRLDVSPMSAADFTSPGEGARRLNLRTRRIELVTRAAKATMEVAMLAGAGEGGVLVCRLLLDLMSAPPSAAACASDEVPLHAELRWTAQGTLVFDAVSVARRTDLAVQDLAAPPSTRAFAAGPVRSEPADALAGQTELLGFRSAPLDLPAVQARDAQAPPPMSGLVLVNQSDELRVVWVDGVAVAWVAPGARWPLPTLVRGRYTVQWRTFLGDAWDPPETAIAPGESVSGKETERR